ncbi:amino acid permease-domain-containing protein [Fusarium sp. MPI-SDFR-AT-0072]|nr:amino acid permease-domain-containing protein [Fusarium sp. MPI-SDFR-AT-0072]
MSESILPSPGPHPLKARDEQEKSPSHLGEVETIRNDSSDPERNEDTHRGFKPRHSQMIAIGGAIGTSLFLGTAQVLRIGGPLFLLISYGVLSIFVYCIVTGIAEIATYLPDSYTGISIPYEFVAFTLLINYWGTAVNGAVWITIIYVIIVIVNLFPVRVFGECEFWSAGMKVLLILGLIFLSIVLFSGGGPDKDALYFRYWKDPGPVNTYIVEGDAGRLVALLQSFVLASFAFVLAPEQRIVTAGEMQSPRYNLSRAARRYIWRLINASITVLDSIVNALILLSAITAANAFLCSASRNLYSLAKAGNVPAIFKRCNRYGLPYYAVLITASLGCLAYLSLSNSSLTVFNWLINLANTSGYISWVCCGIIYVRYRKAITHHKLESPYRSRLQTWGMYFGVIVSIILLLINGFTVFFPSQWSVGDFFTAYIGIPAFLLIYFGHRLYHRGDRWVRNPEDVDMHEGMDEVLAAERPPPIRGNITRRLWALVE